MNKLAVCLLTVLGVGGLISPLAAETEVQVGGQLRVRSEIDQKQFGSQYAAKVFTLMRTRVHVKAAVDNNSFAFVQFQDSRMFGAKNQFGKPQSGLLNDSRNVDIHQAYLQINRLWWQGVGARLGRFELNLGNQRVFGAVGWDNVGRAWEGGTVWYGRDNFRITGLNLRALEQNNAFANQDYDVFGLHVKVNDPDLELFAMYEYDADTTPFDSTVNNLDRIDLGLYFHRRYQKLDFTVNGVFQTGKQLANDSTVFAPAVVGSELNISAFMVAAEVGYTFEGSGHARVAAGIDYSSGDDNNADSDQKAYNNLFYTGHKFRGYMDYFVVSKPQGLVDLMLRGKLDFAPKWTAKGDFHYFTTAQDYADPLNPGILTKDVGVEFDFTVATTSVEGIKLQAGASFFVPKDSYAGMSNPDTGLWLYDMATINF